MSLFTRDASKVWGILLHDTHTFVQAAEHGDILKAVAAGLPTSLSLLQAAFSVLGKCVTVVADGKAAANDGFKNIELNQQEIEDIIALLEAFKPVIDLLMHQQDATALQAEAA